MVAKAAVTVKKVADVVQELVQAAVDVVQALVQVLAADVAQGPVQVQVQLAAVHAPLGQRSPRAL